MDNETITAELKNYMHEFLRLKRKVVRADVSPKSYYENRESYYIYRLQVNVIKKVLDEKMEQEPDHPAFKNFWKDYSFWLEEEAGV